MAGGGEEGSPAAAAPLLLPAAREERSRMRRRRCREGCPGCRLEEASKARPGVPYLNFFYIWVVCLAAGQSGTAHTFLSVVGSSWRYVFLLLVLRHARTRAPDGAPPGRCVKSFGAHAHHPTRTFAVRVRVL